MEDKDLTENERRLMAQVEDETIERCLKKIKRHYFAVTAIKVIENMKRKYSA